MNAQINATGVSAGVGDTQLKSVLSNLVVVFNHQRNATLNQYNVNEIEVELLEYLDLHEQKKMKELGEHFNIKLSTLTSIIDKLENNRLVKRKNSKKDRRVIYIQVTPRTKSLLNDLAQSTNGLSEIVTSALDESEYESLVKGLNLIVSHLKSSQS